MNAPPASAVAVPTTVAPPSKSLMVAFAYVVPLNVGVGSEVISSVGLIPVSLASTRLITPGTVGGVVSYVTVSSPDVEAAFVFPAASATTPAAMATVTSPSIGMVSTVKV